MSNKFTDKRNEKKIVSGCATRANPCYIYDADSNKYIMKQDFMITYNIFQRTIQAKDGGQEFILVYARYTTNAHEDSFVTPLFIMDLNASVSKTLPVYTQLSHAGLYTCKVMEYIEQTHGSLPLPEIRGSQYVFLGDAMNHMWPFWTET